MPNRAFYGWKLLGALWIIVFVNLAFPIYGSSVVNAAMIDDLGMDRATLGLIFSLFTLMSGLPGPLIAVCVNRFGARNTLISGSLLVAVGSVLMATIVSRGWQAAIAFGFIVAIGVGSGGVMAAQVGLVKWFFRRRALALAILSSATAVGGAVAAPLLNKIIESAGGNWRMAWWFVAAISAIAAILALAFVKEKPEDLGQLPDGGAGEDKKEKKVSALKWRGAVHLTSEVWAYREALGSPAFWLLMVSQMGMSFGYTVFIAHGVVHLQDLGHSSGAGSWAISMMALAGLLAKGITGAFGDRIDPRYLWAVFVGLFGIGQLLVVQAATPALLVSVSFCLGMGFGGGVVCLAAVISNYFGTKAFASLSGLAIAINTTMGSITPTLAGWLYDNGYGYQGVFYTIAVWCAAGALILFFMKPPAKSIAAA
jgi:MFS family permease